MSSDQLPNYVKENHAKAIKMDLGTWLGANPLPAFVERKFDGIRIFLFKSGEKLVISSRNGGIYTPTSSPQVFSKMPEFTHAPHRMILDGEYVARDEKSLYFFDVLQVDDRDLREEPLEKRKKVLSEILHGTGMEVPFKRAQTVAQINAAKDAVIKKGGEGVVVKNPLSTYGQPKAWLKLKRFDTVDCFVTGYGDTQELRRTGVPRSWAVAVYDDDGRTVDLGYVGSTVESVDPRKVVKGSVVEVRFQQLTLDKKLRAAFVLRVRHDKTPEECLYSQLE